MNDLKEWSENIKNNLTIEQVNELLYAVGADPIIKNEIIISRTICHGGDSHKLYYYNNTKLFRCYTDCENNIFDIYELVIKIKKQDGIDFNLYQAINFIINFFNLAISNENFFQESNELQDWKILQKYEANQLKKEEKIIEFRYYDDKILKYLPKPKIPMWLNEGITQAVMDHAEIAFNPVNWGIVIPHRDPAGNLIGIRERTLIKEEEENGKYKPAILNYQMYNHALGFNLYNLNNSKDNIRKMKKVVIFEGEKSCLKFASYFGMENDISVAVCGSNITQYQIDLLLNLDVQEIIIAFDKQFKEIGDNEFKIWTKKLTELNKKISKYVKVSFAFDKWNLLNYKDSPIDKDKETFLELFKRRVSL